MNRDDERLLARATTASASAEERAELERRAARDPRLAAAVERWRGAWRELELPPPAEAPEGFAARVAARARAEEVDVPALGAMLGLASHPALARLAAVLILGAGVALGAGLGALAPDAEEETTAEVWATESLAETYFDATAANGDAGEVTP